MKRQEGITLVALVVTIIVLLILAGISINVLTNTEILSKANQSVNKYSLESFKENVSLGMQARLVERKTTGTNKLSLKEEMEQIQNVDFVKELATNVCEVTMGEHILTVYEDGTIVEGKVEISDSWDGTSSEVPEIKGSEWYINNAAEFKFFADFVNNGNQLTSEQSAKLNEEGYEGIENIKLDSTSTVYLMSNLDWQGNSFTPIGDKTNKFIATFDGKDHFIKNANIEVTADGFAGIFGVSSQEIKNLTIKDSVVEAEQLMIGGIVGIGYTITNCHNINTAVTQTLQGFAGGVAGRVDNKITDCTNTGDVTGKMFTGGVAGALNKNATAESCINNGDIFVVEQSGGIIGTTNGGNSIDNCVNNGTINGSGSSVAGIIGVLSDSTINNCSNHGTVTSDGEVIGGISGSTKGTSTIEECSNSKTITSKQGYVGGISGSVESSSIIYKCTNSGDIAADEMMVGGIVGKNNGVVQASTNSGVVTGKYLVGGIVGCLWGTVEGCGNTGTITQPIGEGEEGGSIGGIVGQIGTKATVSIKYCYNRGTIIVNYGGTPGVGGIVGWISIGDGTTGNVTNTYNTGLIQINAENVIGVGGTTGKIESEAVKLANNYCIEGIEKIEPKAGWAVNGTTKSLDDMQSADFITTLNTGLDEDAWEIRNGENDNYAVPIIKEKLINNT